MAVPSRDQALKLLAAANNHGDLAVKLSSLNQAKDILLSLDSSQSTELLPYLVELQSSPEPLVRKSLIEVMEEIGLKATEESVILMPVLLTFLRDSDSLIARQSIISGVKFFCRVLEELALRFHRFGKVERWLEELWAWMVKFKDALFGIILETTSVGTKLLAMKFLVTYVLLFTSDRNESEKYITEGGRTFNISWLVGGHPVLDPFALTSEANIALGILLDMLRSARSLPGSLSITVVNCLALIARKRPVHYSTVFSALLDFDTNFETIKGAHSVSVQYSLRTAFLGFLRCTFPAAIESRERIIRALRAMNAGDAADQVIRQVDKMMKNIERASRDARLAKDELTTQLPVSGDLMKKRSLHQDIEDPNNSHDGASKRIRYSPSDSGQDHVSANGVSAKAPLLDSDLTVVEQMIAMFVAFIAEGERGADSIEILISKIPPDLLADIVINNMKNLPKAPPPLSKLADMPVTTTCSSSSSQVVGTMGMASSVQSPVSVGHVPFTASTTISTSFSDTSIAPNLPPDSKRDPRRDPRRLDPRRVTVPAGVPSPPVLEENVAAGSEFDSPTSQSKPLSFPSVTSIESTLPPKPSETESDTKIIESPLVTGEDQPTPKVDVTDVADDVIEIPEVKISSDIVHSPVHTTDQDSVAPKSLDIAVTDGLDKSSVLEADQHSPDVSNISASEETCHDLPLLPLFVELTEDQKRSVRKLAVERIIESYKHLRGATCDQTRMALLARLVAQIDADDDLVVMLQKHIVLDYQHQKGHELVMHILYHLHALSALDSVQHSSYAAIVYEKFLLAVAKSLLETFPASDKSFSKLLGEVPMLPDLALKLLEDLCYQPGKDVNDGDRVTQGLGAVWSLIVGRPVNRQACLDIALKCAVHLQDDVRAKAIRLVANKLYGLSYLSENIEQFATDMLLSAVNQHLPDKELLKPVFTEQRMEGEVGSHETSISGSQTMESGTSENDSVKGVLSTSLDVPTITAPQAQRLISLFFALCIKKPSLLRLVFDVYGRSPKTVKQAVHRHIPILLRALGSSYSELLHIISDPPQGSENLLTAVLQILTEETTPSPELISTVKHLYETKLKDATILIPMLSSLSKNEVLPIFPRLVDLPLDKFQKALAFILQGSAHTGPALTPAEVLVAIHDINPEKDGLPLKKVTDACSACFEQRTVFTQHVLAKALNQMVDQNPLPLLFMRTVIQAIDAFPTLVDFVMEILSKLVAKQIWRMPKLWVGFLKCVFQTQPHSFRVLLQLPPQQLESALNRRPNLKGPLATFASQPSIKSSLPRATQISLGLVNEKPVQQAHIAPSLHASDTSSSVHGAALT